MIRAANVNFLMRAKDEALRLGRAVCLARVDDAAVPWIIFDPLHVPAEAIGAEMRGFVHPDAGWVEVLP